MQKKAKKFKWTHEADKAFNEIKKLLVSPPVLKAPTPDGLFRLESDTLREGVGGTLLQKQGDEWVVHDPGSHNCAVFVLYTVSIVPSFTSRV